MEQITLTHLRTYIFWLPIVGFGEFRNSTKGTGTITLDHKYITFHYVNSFPYRMLTKKLCYADVTAYFRPFPAILYLDHQDKRLPSIVKIGDTLRDDVQIAEVDKFIKILKTHHISPHRGS